MWYRTIFYTLPFLSIQCFPMLLSKRNFIMIYDTTGPVCGRGKKILWKRIYFPRIHIPFRGWCRAFHPLETLKQKERRGGSATSGASGPRRDIVDVLTTQRAEIRWKGLQGDGMAELWSRCTFISFTIFFFFFPVSSIIGVFLFKEMVVFLGDKPGWISVTLVIWYVPESETCGVRHRMIVLNNVLKVRDYSCCFSSHLLQVMRKYFPGLMRYVKGTKLNPNCQRRK